MKFLIIFAVFMQFESFRAIVHVLICTFYVSWTIERDGENTKVYSGSTCSKRQCVTDKHDEKCQEGELSRRKFIFLSFAFPSSPQKMSLPFLILQDLLWDHWVWGCMVGAFSLGCVHILHTISGKWEWLWVGTEGCSHISATPGMAGWSLWVTERAALGSHFHTDH